MAEKIIEQQESIIGPVALEQARKVHGLNVDWQKHEVAFDGNKTDIVEHLVEQYQGLFGQASVEACKEAVRGIISEVPQNQIPALLR
ncbi:MAG: hypothetical protein HYV37_03520 [Candidatus Levyibacteriota bacterium]|nr:MAG: hypothetical protein HYV37_03520 [Candidatus Levybacteria bacterium]